MAKYSYWINRWLTKDTPISRKASVWEEHDEVKGWSEAMSTGAPWTKRAQNRTAFANPNLKPREDFDYVNMKLPPIVQEAMMANEWECFSCSHPDINHVKGVCYDAKRFLLKILWRKARSGARGAVPKGKVTVYDHVPIEVFEKLKRTNEAMGRVGEEVWNIIKGRGTIQQTMYPMSNLESDSLHEV